MFRVETTSLQEQIFNAGYFTSKPKSTSFFFSFFFFPSLVVVVYLLPHNGEGRTAETRGRSHVCALVFMPGCQHTATARLCPWDWLNGVAATGVRHHPFISAGAIFFLLLFLFIYLFLFFFTNPQEEFQPRRMKRKLNNIVIPHWSRTVGNENNISRGRVVMFLNFCPLLV